MSSFFQCLACALPLSLKPSLSLCPWCSWALSIALHAPVEREIQEADLQCGITRRRTALPLDSTFFSIFLHWKNNRSPELLRIALQKILGDWPSPPRVWIPIPRKSSRAFRYGRCPSSELAHALAGRTQGTLYPYLWARSTSGEDLPQSKFSKQERLERKTPRFVLNERVLPPEGIPWVIVDDVWTTGSTLREAARLLQRQHPNQLLIGVTFGEKLPEALKDRKESAEVQIVGEKATREVLPSLNASDRRER